MEQKLIEIICGIKADETIKNTINSNSNIIEEIGLDSLQMINFILKVEEEFGIEIDFDEFDYSYLSSITNFCNYISSYEKKVFV